MTAHIRRPAFVHSTGGHTVALQQGETTKHQSDTFIIYCLSVKNLRRVFMVNTPTQTTCLYCILSCSDTQITLVKSISIRISKQQQHYHIKPVPLEVDQCNRILASLLC